MRKSRKKYRSLWFFIIVILLAAAVLYIYLNTDYAPANTTLNTARDATLCVLVIDVGQAESILVTMSTGETMLIDAGEDSGADAILEELDARGIERIDVLVATHPHSDHIGGMRSVIARYGIGMVYLPDMTSESQAYENLIDIIEEKNIPVTEACSGESFSLGAARCTIISPGADDDIDANNESVVIYLDYLNTECLFTGDMEEKAEQIVLDRDLMVDADILKVAHHGSYTGTSEDFLSAVSPDYAVISCGEDNSYGHPHKQTLDLLSQYGLTPYRTDLLGDILFTSDGYTIQITTGEQ